MVRAAAKRACSRRSAWCKSWSLVVEELASSKPWRLSSIAPSPGSIAAAANESIIARRYGGSSCGAPIPGRSAWSGSGRKARPSGVWPMARVPRARSRLRMAHTSSSPAHTCASQYRARSIAPPGPALAETIPSWRAPPLPPRLRSCTELMDELSSSSSVAAVAAAAAEDCFCCFPFSFSCCCFVFFFFLCSCCFWRARLGLAGGGGGRAGPPPACTAGWRAPGSRGRRRSRRRGGRARRGGCHGAERWRSGRRCRSRRAKTPPSCQSRTAARAGASPPPSRRCSARRPSPRTQRRCSGRCQTPRRA
mmetsp:Transcript_18730/g.61155  ORF Transcript_18730/g.61155 Transcript_18730/m.61155 type:complete len:307 (+) Transcript_18730:1212-2132(+)